MVERVRRGGGAGVTERGVKGGGRNSGTEGDEGSGSKGARGGGGEGKQGW